jgi:hypothetical protein
MKDDPIHVEPARLVDGDTDAGRALRAALADPSLRGDQRAQWPALRHELQGMSASRWVRHLMLGAAAGLLLAGGSIAIWQVRSTATVAPTPVASADRVIPTGEVAVELPSGPSALGDGTRLELSPQGHAQIRHVASRVTVSLAEGSVDVRVTSRPRGQEFEVVASGYRFSVLGTRFRVALGTESVRLDVREGRVAVSGAGGPMATVAAGQTWQASLTPDKGSPEEPAPRPSNANPASPSVALSVTVPEAAADCLRLAREHQPEPAARCYERVAAGRGLSAEMAQVELARLRRDVLRDVPGAQRALTDYRARYPNGTFRTEAAISLVELLVESGQAAEALDESGRLLATGAAREREAELRVVRGRILQDKLGDCGRAVLEFAKVSADPGPIGDQAQFRQAQCLEALGRSDEAINAYRAYLGRKSPANLARARSRLEALSSHAP